jgi:hypothetical protein
MFGVIWQQVPEFCCLETSRGGSWYYGDHEFDVVAVSVGEKDLGAFAAGRRGRGCQFSYVGARALSLLQP